METVTWASVCSAGAEGPGASVPELHAAIHGEDRDSSSAPNMPRERNQRGDVLFKQGLLRADKGHPGGRRGWNSERKGSGRPGPASAREGVRDYGVGGRSWMSPAALGSSLSPMGLVLP
ncbi:hypothetical protein ASNO1_71320 [Corallococcus caeni]|uniref:Uncharacterized protein n=1 Tax=Corallococcus caeni TaxID=3082388 RepID=A0ABQ6R3I7_9BACT|nr:hypothetical protein ASNO1_71320 [Corallococcus sp. NO1]